MISRREFLGTSLGAGAALALTSDVMGALQPPDGLPQTQSVPSLSRDGKLIQRAIPSTGEMLPVIGLGRGFSANADDAAIKEAVRTLVENGGKVLDTVHGGPPVRQLVGTIARELGIQDKIFWSTGLLVGGPPPAPGALPPKADPGAVKAGVEALFAMLKVEKIDLIQVLAHADVPTHLAVLREMKKEGRVRYIGVTDLLPPPNMKSPTGDKLESIMRNEALDFVGFDYSVGDRRAEQTLLPLAQERKIGVMAYFTFDRGRIFKRAGTRSVPEWAAEFDAKTWAQFFLKYVISHPAVIVARTGTSNAKHMLENIGGGIGRLPNDATRKRMADLVDSWG